jgi:hypothetical protein
MTVWQHWPNHCKMLTIKTSSLYKRYVHWPKERMLLNLRDIAQAKIRTFRQKLSDAIRLCSSEGEKDVLGSLDQSPLPSSMDFQP